MSDDTWYDDDCWCKDCKFAWKAGVIGWLTKPLPRGHYRFYQFRWEWIGTKAWLAIGRLTIRIPGYVRVDGRMHSPKQIAVALRWACREYDNVESRKKAD